MNIISSFSSVRMSALCAFSALLMLSCQDNIEPENGKDDPGKPDDTEEPVDPPVESTDPALTEFTPLSGSNFRLRRRQLSFLFLTRKSR